MANILQHAKSELLSTHKVLFYSRVYVIPDVYKLKIDSICPITHTVELNYFTNWRYLPSNRFSMRVYFWCCYIWLRPSQERKHLKIANILLLAKTQILSAHKNSVLQYCLPSRVLWSQTVRYSQLVFISTISITAQLGLILTTQWVPLCLTATRIALALFI